MTSSNGGQFTPAAGTPMGMPPVWRREKVWGSPLSQFTQEIFRHFIFNNTIVYCRLRHIFVEISWLKYIDCNLLFFLIPQRTIVIIILCHSLLSTIWRYSFCLTHFVIIQLISFHVMYALPIKLFRICAKRFFVNILINVSILLWMWYECLLTITALVALASLLAPCTLHPHPPSHLHHF